MDESATAETITCGSDVDSHVQAIEAYAAAGFDELYVQQVGPYSEDFFNAYAEHVLPRFRA